jgi:hypothetical protein
MKTPKNIKGFAQSSLFQFAMFIIFGLVIALFIYLFMNSGNQLREGMEKLNARAYGNKLCKENRCMDGCIKPRFLSNNCESSIHKSPDGKCYMLCPYECQSPLDKCVYNDCCRGCGKTKIEVPCIGFRKTQNLDPGLAQDQNNTIDLTAKRYYNDNDEPVGKAASSSAVSSNSKAKTLDDAMNDVNNIYDVADAYKIRCPGNILCSANITNTFTECGIPAANSCGVYADNDL